VNWNQPQCEACWIEQEATWDVDEAEGFGYITGIRLPVVMAGPERRVERCAWCGRPTIAGIYKRVDPQTVLYPTDD
jgi:hypothetical protein